jgi:hypothetical protein
MFKPMGQLPLLWKAMTKFNASLIEYTNEMSAYYRELIAQDKLDKNDLI